MAFCRIAITYHILGVCHKPWHTPKIWYEMLFWQHAVTACLLTVHATVTGAHMHYKNMQTGGRGKKEDPNQVLNGKNGETMINDK